MANKRDDKKRFYDVVLGEMRQGTHETMEDAVRHAVGLSIANRGLFGGTAWIRIITSDTGGVREVDCIEIRARETPYCRPGPR